MKSTGHLGHSNSTKQVTSHAKMEKPEKTAMNCFIHFHAFCSCCRSLRAGYLPTPSLHGCGLNSVPSALRHPFVIPLLPTGRTNLRHQNLKIITAFECLMTTMATTNPEGSLMCDLQTSLESLETTLKKSFSKEICPGVESLY